MSSVSHKCTRKWAGLTPEKQKEVVDAAVAMSSATIIKPVKSGKRKRVQKTFVRYLKIERGREMPSSLPQAHMLSVSLHCTLSLRHDRYI